MSKHNALLTLGIGAALAAALPACGGGQHTGAVDPRTAAHTQGGAVIRSQGGQAVTQSANQRFAEAAQLMRQHDEANNGQGDWNAAACNEVAGRFEAAANEQPNGRFPEAWFNRAMAFERCNDRPHAVEALNRAISTSAHGYCGARTQLGVYRYRDHQTADALALFDQAIREDPNCVEAYTNRAMLYRERGQGNDRVSAVGDIRQALARDDRYIPALNQLALTYLAEAGDDPRSQRLMLAGIVCSQAVQVAQQHTAEMSPDVRTYVADVYNTWGLIDIRVGQIIRALDHFRRAYQLNANMYEAWSNYGTINLSFRGYQDARDAFQHAVQLIDSDSHCEQRAESRERCYDAHIGLGVALRGLQQNQEAQQQYERARAIDANRPDAFYNLGVLYENYMGGEIADLRRAQGFLNEFVTKAGSNARYTDAVARARTHLRNLGDAIHALEQVQQMNQQSQAAGGGDAAPANAAPANGAPAGGTAPAGNAPAAGAQPANGAAH